MIKSKLKNILILTLILNLFAFNNIAYASNNEVADAVKKYNTTSIPDDIKGLLSNTQGANTVQVEINGKPYYYDPSKSKDIVKSLEAQNKAVQNENTIQDTNDAIGMFTLKANVSGAKTMLSGFEGGLSMLLGVIVTALTLGMTVFTAFDLAYITFPVFRGKMDEAKSSGTSGIATKTTKGGETKLRFITDDAQYAMMAADTINSGQNPYIIYGKKRIVSFVVLSVLIFILVTGRINIFAEMGIKLADGILKILGGM